MFSGVRITPSDALSVIQPTGLCVVDAPVPPAHCRSHSGTACGGCQMRSILVVLLILLGAPAALAQPTPNAADALVHINVYVEAREGNVLRKQLIDEGSGFIINPAGWVITSRHLFDNLVPPGGKLVFEGALKTREAPHYQLSIRNDGDDNADVALLQFPATMGGFPYLCVEQHPQIVVDREVKGLGYPAGRDYSSRPGAITSLMGDDGLVEVNVGLTSGMSGGPVIASDDLAVLGVVTGGLGGGRGFDYFTPVHLALPLFQIPPAHFTGEDCDITSASRSPIEKSYEIDRVYALHRLFGTSVERFYEPRDADPGYRIVDAQLVTEAGRNVDDVKIEVTEDGTSALLSFTLSSGPQSTTDRGWLHGRLVLRMEPVQQ